MNIGHRRIVRALLTAQITISAACNQSVPPTSPSAPPVVGLSCGIERWAVKTLSDPDADRVNLEQVTPATITSLNALTPHCSNLPDRRTFAEEFQTYEISGRVTRVRLEEDRDYHIAAVDPVAPDQSMIVESVDPRCQGAVASPHIALLTRARAMFDALIGSRQASLVGQIVRVRGVGFFDFDHGQTGRSRSCFELHPIIRIERSSS